MARKRRAQISGGQPSGPDYAHERELAASCGGLVAGVDEAGRGPWAGPVLAAAVILNEADIPPGLDDSKKLAAARREKLCGEIERKALAIGMGRAEVGEIDRLNILQASMLAMQRAIETLPVRPAGALIDGNRAPVPAMEVEVRTLIGGDGLSLSIAAASIMAKVARDRLMCELAGQYPQYGFERHKGYGTRAHSEALARHGACPHHRRSFRPVRRVLEAGDCAAGDGS
jgi:ribonuclease HII